MTVSVVTPRVKYNGSGSTGPFSIPFYWLNSAELLVTKTSTAGVESTLAVTTNFTLTGAGTVSGGLTLLVALAADETLVIERATTQTQGLDLQRSYLDYELLETSLDKITRHIQDLWWRAGRALSLYKDDTTGTGSWDAQSNKIANLDDGVDDQDAATLAQLNAIAGSTADAEAAAIAAAASAAAAANSAQELEDIVLGSVTSFEGRTGVVTATAGDYTAAEVTSVPSGNLSAVTVQAALDELQTDINGRQTLDAELTALAGLVSAADKLPYFTGSGTAALASLTSFARNILDDVDGAAVRTTLGVVPGTNVQAYSTALATLATDITTYGQGLVAASTASAARTALELGSAATADATDFAAADATLSALAVFNVNGLLTQTAPDTFVGRTITGSAGISVADGNGVADHPTLSIDINGLTSRTAFESGDKLMIYEAGVGIRKIDYDDLPLGGGSGSGGGASNAYKTITDGSNNAVASGIDTFKVRAGTGLSVTVGNDDVTHGDNILYQLDATLAALAGVTVAADKLIYATGADAFSTTGLTAFARTLLDDADAAGMQTTLGLVPGVNVQAYDAQLADVAGLAVTDGNFIVGNGTNFVAESGATARTSLGLAIGTNVQAYDAELAALASLTSAADALPYFTGLGTASTATFTSFARTLLDDADAAAMKTTLGLVIGTNVQAYDAFLQDIADLTDPDADRILFWDDTLGKFTWLTLGTNLSITGTTIDAASASFPAGTLMLFAQTAAPTGWTKSTAHNDKALRVVSGTASSGGSVAFTTCMASKANTGTIGGTSLSEAQMPSHSHAVPGYVGSGGVWAVTGYASGSASYSEVATNSKGSGSSHTHSYTGDAINMAIAYVDVIIASKD